MSSISKIFGSIMRFFYETLQGKGAEPEMISFFAISILLMAVVSKLITIPLTYQSTKNSAKMKDFQPQLEKLKEKYGYDERILQQKTMEFYKENNLSAAGCSSCLPMVIQLVLIVALFAVLKEPGKFIFDNPDQFNHIQKNFFWIQDLSQADPLKWFGLPLINMVTTYASTFLNPAMKMQKDNPAGGSAAMLKFMPLIFYFMSISWSAGLILYWAFGNLLEVIFRLISGAILSKRPAKDQA